MKKTAFLALLLFVVGMHAHAAAIIRNAATAAANQWVCFRKTINISEGDLSQAELRIAADSKYWLWVNGELEVFEGQLKRGPNATDTYIDVLRPKHLHEGDNTIAVLVWYFGKEGFSHRNSPCPGLYFDLTVDDTHFGSDGLWRTSIHSAYYTPSGDTPNWRLAESNVGFDARRDMNGWEQPAYDDSGWGTAQTVDTAESGWGSFVERPIPQWKDYGVRSYVSQETSGNTITCTLPYNAQVTPILTVRASAGKTIGIQTDDYKPTGENSVRAEYITKEGEQTYESLGWMNGHEVIYTIPEGVEVLSLGYRETGYDCEFAGSFSCNDADLNRLWQMSQRTLYITMRDNFMDCPDRERAQWIGDFAIELEEIFYSLSGSANLLSSKCLHEFAAWQHEDGTLHAPVPAGNYDVELPQQCLAAVGWGAWNYYLGTGDRKTIEDVFPAWKTYMHLWQMDENGLVVYRQGGWDWGDWGSNQDMQALCQFWYAVALDYYAQQADLVGETTEAEWARTLNESLKAAIRQKLWTGSAYRHPDYTGATDDRTQAMAILSGVATEDQYAAIYHLLKTTQYASPYMERFVLEALCRMGHVDDAVARMRSRYQPMIDSSYSTLWELFTLSGGTYNHAWSGAPLLIMSQYVAGVQPLEAGFKKFLVRPHLGSLRQVATTVPTTYGDIIIESTRTTDLTLSITVPDGTTARLSLPACYSSVTLNSAAASFSPSADGRYQELEVEAGTYTVCATGGDYLQTDCGWERITSLSQTDITGNYYVFVADDADLMLNLENSDRQIKGCFYRPLDNPALHASSVWTLEANGENYAMRNLAYQCVQMQTGWDGGGWATPENDRWMAKDQYESCEWTELALQCDGGVWTLVNKTYDHPLGLFGNVTGTPTDGSELGANEPGYGQRFRIYAIPRDAYAEHYVEHGSNPDMTFTITNAAVTSLRGWGICEEWWACSAGVIDSDDTYAGANDNKVMRVYNDKWNGNAWNTLHQTVTLPKGMYSLSAYTKHGNPEAGEASLYCGETKQVFANTAWEAVSIDNIRVAATSTFDVGFQAGLDVWQAAFADDFRITCTSEAFLDNQLAAAAAFGNPKCESSKMNALLNALSKAEAAKSEGRLAPMYDAASALESAIGNASTSIAEYARVKSLMDWADAQATGTHALTSDALCTYNTLMAPLRTAYNEGTLNPSTAPEDIRQALANAAKTQPVGSDYTLAIVNPSFETGDLTGWTAPYYGSGWGSVEAASTAGVEGSDGNYHFNTWQSDATYLEVSQTISGLRPGYYSLSAVAGGAEGTVVKLSVNDKVVGTVTMTDEHLSLPIPTEDIYLAPGTESMTIRLYTENPNGNWFRGDNFCLTYSGLELAVGAAHWATFIAPFEVTLPEGVTASTVDDVDADGVLQLTSVNPIPPHTPVVLYSDSPVSQQVNGTAVEASNADLTEGLLTGAYFTMQAPDGSYVMQNHSGRVGFYHVDTAVATPQVGAYRAYLSLPEAQQVRQYLGFGSPATGISETTATAPTDGVAFDLMGRRADRLTKGIVIINNKKVILK